ncbi:MAG: DUF4230 domain-containing protein [Rhodothermia bacterium]|nr:DUF4230 domain-containing protein [Rhodothermia bacterium]
MFLKGRYIALAIVAILLLIIGLFVGWSIRGFSFGLNNQQLREVVVSTLQVEADTTYLVTGYLGMEVTKKIVDEKTLWGIPMGTTEVQVRVPGRVTYGFPIGQLRADDIEINGQNITVYIPPVGVFSVEPELAKMDIQTKLGWARFQAFSGKHLEHRAIKSIPAEMRQIGEERLIKAESKASENTVKAIRRILVPVLSAAGMQNPQIQVRLKRESIFPKG